MILLITKNTRDEGYRWSAHHKEKRMHRILKTLKTSLSSVLTENKDVGLERFLPKKEESVKVFVDHREKSSGVVKELVDLGVSIRLETLEHAYYLLSSRVGIEFKTTEDFVNSIIDGRLLQQLKNLKQNLERPLLIIEGEEDIYSILNIHPNAIRGMLATITVSYGIPVLQTKDKKETAALLYIIAKREQEELSKEKFQKKQLLLYQSILEECLRIFQG